MSFGYYFNLQRLAYNIVEKNLLSMNDNNVNKETAYVNEKEYLNNLESGFVIVTMLNSLIESTLNEVLNNYINFKTDIFLKKSFDEKIAIICLYYHKDLSRWTGLSEYKDIKTIINVRNELVHYKKRISVYAGSTPNICIGQYSLAEIFTKTEMNRYKCSVLDFLTIILADIDLIYDLDVDIIACTEGCENYEFIIPKNTK